MPGHALQTPLQHASWPAQAWQQGGIVGGDAQAAPALVPQQQAGQQGILGGISGGGAPLLQQQVWQGFQDISGGGAVAQPVQQQQQAWQQGFQDGIGGGSAAALPVQQAWQSVNDPGFGTGAVASAQRQVNHFSTTTGKGLRELAVWTLVRGDHTMDGATRVRAMRAAVAGRNGGAGALRPDPDLMKALASGQIHFLALPLQYFAVVSTDSTGPLAGELVVEEHRLAKVVNKTMKFSLAATEPSAISEPASLIYAAQTWDSLMGVIAPSEAGKMMRLVLGVLVDDAPGLAGRSNSGNGRGKAAAKLPPLWAHALEAANKHIAAWGHNLAVAASAVVAPSATPDRLYSGALDHTSPFHRLSVAPAATATAGDPAPGGY